MGNGVCKAARPKSRIECGDEGVDKDAITV